MAKSLLVALLILGVLLFPSCGTSTSTLTDYDHETLSASDNAAFLLVVAFTLAALIYISH